MPSNMETMSISSSEKSLWNTITWARQVYTLDMLQCELEPRGIAPTLAECWVLSCPVSESLLQCHVRLSKGTRLLTVQLTARKHLPMPRVGTAASSGFHLYHHGKWGLLFYSLDSHWWSHHFPCQRQNGEGDPLPPVQFRVFLYKYMYSLSTSVSSVTTFCDHILIWEAVEKVRDRSSDMVFILPG